MKNLIIVGAGGFGREVLQWAMCADDNNVQWQIKGFLDDNNRALDGKNVECKLIGSIEEWIPAENEVFVCAIASPSAKENVVNKLKKRGAIFTSVIHPTAIIATSASIGEGVIMCPRVLVSADTKIGNFVILNVNTSVGHDAIIGDFSTFNSYCDITGNVVVEEKVFAGTSVKIVPFRRIEKNAFLCAGSVIITNIKESAKVIGNPAKKMKL